MHRVALPARAELPVGSSAHPVGSRWDSTTICFAAAEFRNSVFFGRAQNEISPTQILAAGRWRGRDIGRSALREGAELSDAADPAGHSLSAGRRLRPRRPTTG